MKSGFANAGLIVGRWRGLLFDLVFPPRCASCRRVGESFCSVCRAQIEFVRPPLCPRCGLRIMRTGDPCFACRAFPHHARQIRSVAYFSGALRRAIHAFKYLGRQDLALPLSAMLIQHLAISNWEFDVIAPIPLHPERQKQRGYNQSELLGRRIAEDRRVPLAGGLKRVRATADQVGLDARARRENVRFAFEANACDFRGAKVLLIDDVCTTGATLEACAETLLEEGARTVYALTVARAEIKKHELGGKYADDYHGEEHAGDGLARILRSEEDREAEPLPQ